MWTCPQCRRSFAARHQTHTCALLGDLDEHFRDADPTVRQTFDAVLAAVRACGPVAVLPERSRIALHVRMSFAAFTVRRHWLNGQVVLARRVDSPRFSTVQEYSPRNVLHAFRLTGPTDVDAELVGWLTEAYRVGCQEHLRRPVTAGVASTADTSPADANPPGRWANPASGRYRSAMSAPAGPGQPALEETRQRVLGDPDVRRVVDHLTAHHARGEVVVLAESARTAKEAAAALDVEVAQIANSLVFLAYRQDETTFPLLVMTSGAHRVNVVKVGDLLGLARITRADPDYVRATSGFAVGGVAPVGHRQQLTAVVDVSLSRYPRVWAAAGHPNAVFPTSYDELLLLTGGHPIEVV